MFVLIFNIHIKECHKRLLTPLQRQIYWQSIAKGATDPAGVDSISIQLFKFMFYLEWAKTAVKQLCLKNKIFNIEAFVFHIMLFCHIWKNCWIFTFLMLISWVIRWVYTAPQAFISLVPFYKCEKMTLFCFEGMPFLNVCDSRVYRVCILVFLA